jgi:hypothetical protein
MVAASIDLFQDACGVSDNVVPMIFEVRIATEYSTHFVHDLLEALSLGRRHARPRRKGPAKFFHPLGARRDLVEIAMRLFPLGQER